MIQCGFQGLWVLPSTYDSLLFTPLYASTRADGLALKIKPPVATVHFPAKPRLWFPAEKAKLQALCLALRRGGRGLGSSGLLPVQSHQTGRRTTEPEKPAPLCRSRRSPPEPEEPPTKSG